MEIENWTVKKVLEMGAEMELQSYMMYTKHAENSEYPGGSRLLTKLAEDELRHRKYFIKALENPDSIEVRTLEEDIPDLKVTDKLINVPLDPSADFPQILKFAAQRESAAYDFYIMIAGKHEGTELGKLFHNFALEELKHKKLLEDEYDEITGW